jgi:hypothetical protein
MYTDGFVKNRQLNMNVAHFASPIAEGSGDNSSSSDSEEDAAWSERSVEESVVSDNTNTGEVMLHACMINTSNNQGNGSDSGESFEDNDAHDGDDVKSYQCGLYKMMECTICKANVRKELYPCCHSNRDSHRMMTPRVGHMWKIMMNIALSTVRSASAMSRKLRV